MASVHQARKPDGAGTPTAEGQVRADRQCAGCNPACISLLGALSPRACPRPMSQEVTGIQEGSGSRVHRNYHFSYVQCVQKKGDLEKET